MTHRTLETVRRSLFFVRRHRLLTAACRAIAAAGLALPLASLVGCNRYEAPIFDPSMLELPERRGANDANVNLEKYPATLQAIPTPRGGDAGGPRPPNSAYISTLPTTGRTYDPKNAVHLSLREVITRAVLYNSEVKVAGYDPAINAQRVIEEEAVFDPAAFLNMSTARNDSSLSTFSQTRAQLDAGPGTQVGNTLAGFNQKTVTNTGSTGLRQRLITGGEARLSYGWTWNRIDDFGRGDDNRFWQNDLRLEITQPLLRDFGRDVNSARIEIARGDQKISVLDFRRALEEQISELERAYWQLEQANRIVEIQETLLAETIETYRVLYERWVRGLDASKIPVSQAQSSVRARQADLIRAKQNVLDLSDEIKRRMNDPEFPVSSGLVIVPSDVALEDPVNFLYDEAIDAAVKNRLELGQQLIRIEQARVAERVAANNKLPRVDFVGSFGFRGLGDGAGEASKNLWDFNSPSWQFGLEMEYPLGNRAARAIFERARLQRLQAIEQYRNILAQVSLDVKTSMTDIRSSWEQAAARTQSRLASREQLDLIQKQQDLGEPITPPFIQVKLQAQETLANEAREQAAAIANYNIAIQRLERAKGTLLKYNNIQLKEDPGMKFITRAWVEEATQP